MLIIIQGPFSKNTKYLTENIASLFPNFEIIVSCYKDEINHNLPPKYKNIKFIYNSDPGSELIPPRGKPLNLKRQATTILSACEESSEKWVIKIRSDLYINNKILFKKAINNFENSLSCNNPPKLITLNTGSLDIFSHYDMLFHFNDWFFICEREVLIRNCKAIKSISESSLIEPFINSYPKNYYHAKKYRLIFHNEQLIHFADKLLKKNIIKYGCQNNKFSRYRHIIWVAKYLKLVSLRDIGIKSAKVGYPKFKSELVCISFKSHSLHKLLISSKGFLRFFIMKILLIHGGLRKYLFLILNNKNKLKIKLIQIKNSLI